MVIKAVIFDCFGVLVLSTYRSLQNTFPEHAEELEDLRKRSDYGTISRSDYDKAVAELVGLPLGEVEAKYWRTSIRNESVLEWVKQLKTERIYKVGLLSNVGVGWLEDFISVDERAELFDVAVLSGEVGMTKPSVEIFEYTADTLGVQPHECVMIDDLPEYLVGAERAGMQTILFTSIDQVKNEFASLEKQ